MRTNRRRQSLAPLLRNARLEVLPTPTAEQRVTENVAVGRTITVTASPNRGLEATLDLAERLAGQGYQAVPHLAARMVSGRSELVEITERLLAVGIYTVFVPAGDADSVAGDYASSVDLLEDLAAIGRPFADVGVTGYPESHPMIVDDVTVQSMWDKRRHATYIVSNMCFNPRVLRTWIVRIRKRGITLPLLVGLAGPVERAKLLAMATKIGVGESTRFLTKNRSAVAKIASPGYSPERLLDKTAATLTAPESLVTGLHLFTFNQVAEVERWRARLLAAAEDGSLVG
ncbi:MAG: methylenetetrahydrofolate reductase [Nocardioidaceae bacterium]|nr:methylenetetrahydrofolate reductase [Nocardioidaceae bacterium]